MEKIHRRFCCTDIPTEDFGTYNHFCSYIFPEMVQNFMINDCEFAPYSDKNSYIKKCSGKIAYVNLFESEINMVQKAKKYNWHDADIKICYCYETNIFYEYKEGNFEKLAYRKITPYERAISWEDFIENY